MKNKKAKIAIVVILIIILILGLGLGLGLGLKKTKTPDSDNKKTTINFIIDGNEHAKIEATENSINMPTPPVKEGYSFIGWYTALTGGVAVTSIAKGTTGNKTLYAIWEATSYTITYNLNGGENDESNPSSYTIETSTITLADATKSGYTLDGWYDAATEGNKVLTIEEGSTGNKTLYAIWEATTYNITYHNTENAPNSNPNIYTIETNTITLSGLSMAGATFLGWFTAQTGGTKVETIPKGSFGSLNLHARWSLVSTNVFFDVNGGEGSHVDVVVAYGDTFNFPVPTHSNASYVFAGWYMPASEGGNQLTEEDGISKYTWSSELASVTVVAAWITPTDHYTRIDEDCTENTNGAYIFFGNYPQTIKESSVTVGTTANSDGYYLGSDNALYAKIESARSGAAAGSYYTFSNGENIIPGDTYYFKVEPLKWRILDTVGNTAYILCENTIGRTKFSNSNISNYEDSNLRAWLNTTFYEKAFSSFENKIIRITEVDNSAQTTTNNNNTNICPNTIDKIFAPSYRDIVNTNYGFDARNGVNDPMRSRYSIDYLRAQGLYMVPSGKTHWWTRSPYTTSPLVNRIQTEGLASAAMHANNYSTGAVPALRIRLS